ncbi:trypsin-like serine peptidase [Pseudomonas soli]|jgi:V8-like Glu-specific endopeptidase|uniref:Peptidase S1 domain-containing protein n=1 Tax=Pseudomonas soli TaxID=1306993 RepID=A0A2V4HGX6_9PSED|nr:hypothetical protein [Pseudomonas soli]PYB76741.1 hypothetical protein DMX07_20460 [Pseudomonas soli]
MQGLIALSSLFVCASVLGATVEPVQSPEQDEAAVLAFWDPARMRQAERAVGGPANPVDEVLTENGDHLGFVREAHAHQGALSSRAGILFYVSGDGVPQHCSATVLKSAQENLVLTAAHCVIERGEVWKQKMLFVPAYDGAAAEGERAPFGRWPIRYKYIPHLEAYRSEESDLAIVSIFAQGDQSLEQAVGGGSRACLSERGSQLPNSQIWGYPGVSYSGGEMRRCLSRMDDLEGSSGVGTPNCSTISGSSGSAFRFQQNDDWAIAVVHGSGQSTRLRESTFQALYRLASGSDAVVPRCLTKG